MAFVYEKRISMLNKEAAMSNIPRKMFDLTDRFALLRKKVERKIPCTVPRKMNSAKTSIWSGICWIIVWSIPQASVDPLSVLSPAFFHRYPVFVNGLGYCSAPRIRNAKNYALTG